MGDHFLIHYKKKKKFMSFWGSWIAQSEKHDS